MCLSGFHEAPELEASDRMTPVAPGFRQTQGKSFFRFCDRKEIARVACNAPARTGLKAEPALQTSDNNLDEAAGQ
jgi:hypothetical protein